MQMRSEGSTITVPVPNHREIKSGTLAAIIRQSGVSRQEFKTWFPGNANLPIGEFVFATHTKPKPKSPARLSKGPRAKIRFRLKSALSFCKGVFGPVIRRAGSFDTGLWPHVPLPE